MTLLNKHKHFIVIAILASLVISKKVIAQKVNDTTRITQKELVGIWQKGSNIVGSGLMQNFHFFSDGTFVLNLGDDGDDARTLIRLKGKYRLNKSNLYFTIIARTVVEGKIGVADMLNLGLFLIESGKIKEFQETNPKEISDPCFITVFSKSKIKLNNELYYKIK